MKPIIITDVLPKNHNRDPIPSREGDTATFESPIKGQASTFLLFAAKHTCGLAMQRIPK